MPNKDGTGPEGKGPKTGRQIGNCKDAKPIGNCGNRRQGLGPCGKGLGRKMGLRGQNQLQEKEE